MALRGLGFGGRKMEVLHMCKLLRWTTAAFLITQCAATKAEAFTQVLISTAAPVGLETTFLAATTNQFLGVVTANPLAANTYTLKLFGLNPNFNPPPTTLEQALSLGATVYVYGFADGQAYERHQDLNIIGNFDINCDSSTYFDIHNGTNTIHTPIDLATCNTVLGAAQDAIYTQNFSTPTVIPPPTGN